MSPLHNLQQSIIFQMAADPVLYPRMSMQAKHMILAAGAVLLIAAAAVLAKPAYAQNVSAERGFAGQVIGGVVGGLLGSRVGGGHGKEIATAAGAILGSMVGDSILNDKPARSAPVQTQSSHTYYEAPRMRATGSDSTRETVRYTNPDAYQSQSTTGSERGVAGAIIGGGTGALLGSQIGKGNGKLVATAGMGIVGAIVGDSVQNSDIDRRAQATREIRTHQQTASVTSYAAPAGNRMLSGEERQQMDLIVKSMQQSRATWIMSLSAVESAKSTNLAKPELAKMQQGEMRKRASFIAQRDDFTNVVNQMANANFDVGQYAVIAQAYSEVTMASKEKSSEQISVQVAKRAPLQVTPPRAAAPSIKTYQSLTYGG